MKYLLVLLLPPLSLLLAPSVAQADPIDDLIQATFDGCVGPGPPDPDQILQDFFAQVSGFERAVCAKACKQLASGCVHIINAQKKCGIKVLTDGKKLGTTLCVGDGNPKPACAKGAKALVKDAISVWKALVDVEIAACKLQGEDCAAGCR